MPLVHVFHTQDRHLSIWYVILAGKGSAAQNKGETSKEEL